MSETEDPGEERRGDPASGSDAARDPRTPRDESEVWEEIVANYGERAALEADGGPRRDPSAGSARPDSPADPHERPAASSSERPEPWEPANGWFAAEPINLDGPERYDPPAPPPLPRPAPDRLLAWGGVLGAPVVAVLLVLLRAVVDFVLPGWAVVVLVGAFLAGFGYLIATMPKGPADPWDDGARV